jgi:hypothetical protein
VFCYFGATGVSGIGKNVLQLVVSKPTIAPESVKMILASS